MKHTSTARTPARWLGWIRDAWLIAGVVLLLLLVVDAGLKAWLPERPGLALVQAGATAPGRAATDAMAGADWAADYFVQLRAARHTRWQPWTYWRRLPFTGSDINIGADGVRRSWEPADAEREIWMLGGSTVWGTAARDLHTLPSHLARSLAAAGLAVRVVNLGESGYVTGQDQIHLLRRLETASPPAAVIFYGGVNDVFAALQAGQAGLSQNEQHRYRDFRVTDGLDNWLAAVPSVLEGVARLAARLGTRPEPPASEALAADIAEIYSGRIKSSAALLSARGIPVLFAWQPSVFSRARHVGDEAAIVASSLAAHRDLQQAADRAVGNALAGRRDFIHLAEVFDGESGAYYVDFCHVSEAGNAKLAEALAKPVAALLESAP